MTLVLPVTTNIWNVIKFLLIYILIDFFIPLVLTHLDKSFIVAKFARRGAVPIGDFIEDRTVRTGLANLPTILRRAFRRQTFSRRHTWSFRPLLLCSLWIATFVLEFGSGSRQNMTQVTLPLARLDPASQLFAMLSCSTAQATQGHPLIAVSLRNATFTTHPGLLCSCTGPDEPACALPVEHEDLQVTTNFIGQGKFFSELEIRRFFSTGPVQVETHNRLVLVKGRGTCNMCISDTVGAVDDIEYHFHAKLDTHGKLYNSSVYSAYTGKGTLVGYATARPLDPTGKDQSLDSLFFPSSTIAFVLGASQGPDWRNRSSAVEDLQSELIGKRTYSSEIISVWASWWLRGELRGSTSQRTVVVNELKGESATVNVAGIVGLAYIGAILIVTGARSIARTKWMRILKTSGDGNVEWLISALIAQQQIRGASLRGVDDLKQFDITIVSSGSYCYHASAHHWLRSLAIASPTRQFDRFLGQTPLNRNGQDLNQAA